MTQAKNCGVLIKLHLEEAPVLVARNYDVFIDAIFGFSFVRGERIREPYNDIIKKLNDLNKRGLPVISVDIPSGWEVNKGYEGEGLE